MNSPMALIIGCVLIGSLATIQLPCAAQTSQHQGATLYVSKLGDGSDGSSWAKAFKTIQAALDAVPDDQGGHRIVIRPDTYMEANLAPAQKGAAGAYNELVGDFDGSLGSGTSGWVVMDSGDPEKGFKSYDWWGNLRAMKQGWSAAHTEPTFSAIGWDRWVCKRLYATGGDGALMWDCTDKTEPFTVVAEDCVGIGRAFGGGVGNCLSRKDEPIVFRRCHFWALDTWGDTAAGYVRVENPAMPDQPDVYFEDCMLVSPKCSLKGGNYGFTTFTRARLKNCRLVTLNFSQPQGEPTDGVIQSVEDGKYFHVELEDCTLMGYKVFGVMVNKDTVKDLGYTIRGSARAYVQFQQEVPAGFTRLPNWPVEVFQDIVPPPPAKPGPALVKEGVVTPNMCEATPVVWKDRLCLFECVRPGSGGKPEDHCLTLKDVETGNPLARFGEGYSLACAFVHDGAVYVFASRFEPSPWNDVTLFCSSDLASWEKKLVIEQDKGEQLFNSSVCEGPDGFVMAYETNDPKYPAFTVKFARSADLKTWTKAPDAIFGKDRYTACPCIRYVNGYYYLLYLEQRTPRWFFETYIARSKDLKDWTLSPLNPVLTPDQNDEGINASDPDIIEWQGKTYLYYNVGDQRTWGNLKRAVFSGSLQAFLEGWFPNG